MKFSDILKILNPFIWFLNAVNYFNHLETYRHAEYRPYDFKREDIRYFPREKQVNTDISTIELKPCPMCGGEAEVVRVGTTRQSSIVECTECGLSLEANEQPWYTGSAWNKRI